MDHYFGEGFVLNTTLCFDGEMQPFLAFLYFYDDFKTAQAHSSLFMVFRR